MEAVNNIGKNITIILIAHRLSTVKKCDQIFLLEKGQLKNQGTFEELINVDENFKISANN
jgi:ABC-type multidrug transport system fused ATPase/permease subunit